MTTYQPKFTALAMERRSLGQASRWGRNTHNTLITANPLTTVPHTSAQ